MVSPLQKAVDFFKEFGLFDVVLPFLLVFTVVFAILEKTKILGTEKVGNDALPKRNLNAVVAFVFGMLVIAANKVVDAINTALPNIVFLVVIIISFLMLVGSLYKTGEFDLNEKEAAWKTAFVSIIFVLVVLIFTGSIKKTPDQSYLSFVIGYAIENFSGTIVTSVIFLAIAVGAIIYVTRPTKGAQPE